MGRVPANRDGVGAVARHARPVSGAVDVGVALVPKAAAVLAVAMAVAMAVVSPMERAPAIVTLILLGRPVALAKPAGMWRYYVEILAVLFVVGKLFGKRWKKRVGMLFPIFPNQFVFSSLLCFLYTLCTGTAAIATLV
jgi:hypothetical protein